MWRSITVRATEYAPPEAIVARILQVSLVGSTICFTWESKIGTNYVLQGKVNDSDPQWDALSPTITAVNITTTYCIDRSTTYSIFRVIEGAASTNVGPAVINLASASAVTTTNSPAKGPDYYKFVVVSSSVRAVSINAGVISAIPWSRAYSA